MDSQQAFDSNPSDAILLDPNSDKSSLHNWLKAEFVHWKQRSKISHLQDGDRNTKFFHLSAKSTGIINRIDRILVGGNLLKMQARSETKLCSFFPTCASPPPPFLQKAYSKWQGLL